MRLRLVPLEGASAVHQCTIGLSGTRWDQKYIYLGENLCLCLFALLLTSTVHVTRWLAHLPLSRGLWYKQCCLPTDQENYSFMIQFFLFLHKFYYRRFQVLLNSGFIIFQFK